VANNALMRPPTDVISSHVTIACWFAGYVPEGRARPRLVYPSTYMSTNSRLFSIAESESVD